MLGDGIKYRGLPVQNVDVEAGVENSMAKIQKGRINLDALNSIDFAGEAELAAPIPTRRTERLIFKILGSSRMRSKGLEKLQRPVEIFMQTGPVRETPGKVCLTGSFA